MAFILIFDIPFGEETLRRHINRALTKIDAEQIQQSVWKLDNLIQLIDIAGWIKKAGGNAKILEEKFIFE